MEMTDIYDRAKASAARMLAPRSKGGKGLEMTLRRVTSGEYDPETGTAGETVEEFRGSAFRDTFDQADINGTTIQQDDVKFLVSPVLLNGMDMPKPGQGDSILFDQIKYAIVNVKPWNYAGLAVGFEVQARE